MAARAGARGGRHPARRHARCRGQARAPPLGNRGRGRGRGLWACAARREKQPADAGFGSGRRTLRYAGAPLATDRFAAC
jgi:hypothetical protein